YSPYGAQGMIGTNSSINENIASNRTEEALNRLMEVVTRMMTQIQDQRRPFRPRPLAPSTTQNSGIVCYNCGRPDIYLGTVSSNSNGGIPDPLQALYALLNNSNVMNFQGNPSYLGIPEDDKDLFLQADCHIRKKPITGTEILQKKKNGKVLDTSSGLVETEEVVNPDLDMTKEQEEPRVSPEEKQGWNLIKN
ncbi:15211_t:CDS:2, partial [Gigaspora margarita]